MKTHTKDQVRRAASRMDVEMTLSPISVRIPVAVKLTGMSRSRIYELIRDQKIAIAKDWFDFAFATGVRPSEQVVIYWSDIDWRRKTIRIQRALVKGEIKSTKTSSVRDVDLTARALAVLERQQGNKDIESANTSIFLNPVTNRPWPDEKQQRERYFLPTLEALRIRTRGAYQTRHTFATIALMGGVNPAYIARQLGHSTTAMLFKHYAKWIDGADRGREASRLSTLIGGGVAPREAAIGYSTILAEEFDADPRRARETSEAGPLYITSHGRPMRVLLTMSAYEKLLNFVVS